METIQQLLSEMKKAIKDEDNCERSLGSLYETLFKVLQQVEKTERQQEGHLAKLMTLRSNLQQILSTQGLRVKTRDDFRILFDLWEMGFDHFPITLLPSQGPEVTRQMRFRYGNNLRFDHWNAEYKWISESRLTDEISLFEGKIATAEPHRVLYLRALVDVLKAESARREVENRPRLNEERKLEDHWRTKKD